MKKFLKPAWGKVALMFVLLFSPLMKEQLVCGTGLPGDVCPSRYVRGYEIILGLADRLTMLILPRGYYLSSGVVDDLLEVSILVLLLLIMYIAVSMVFAIGKRLVAKIRSWKIRSL